MRRGFAADRIRVSARGEDHPLVETEDGVAEPQNRLVLFFMDAAPASVREAEPPVPPAQSQPR